jgi:hypothetical protein
MRQMRECIYPGGAPNRHVSQDHSPALTNIVLTYSAHCTNDWGNGWVTTISNTPTALQMSRWRNDMRLRGVRCIVKYRVGRVRQNTAKTRR